MTYLDTLFIFCCLCTNAIATITWDSIWINISRPDINGTKIEAPPNATYLNNICPAGRGTLAIRCMDDKGEAFDRDKTDPVNGYTVTCNPTFGIYCNPIPRFNRTCPDFAMNFGCDIPDTTTVAYASRLPQYGASPTPHNPGINQTRAKPGPIILMTHTAILISSFTTSNAQTGTGTSMWRSTTSHTSNTDTSSNTSPLVGAGNQKSGTGTSISRTTTPHLSGTNVLSITTRLDGVGNQKSSTGTSMLGSTLPHPSVAKTSSDTSPTGGAGNQILGTGTIVPRTTTTHLSKTNTVSKKQPIGGAGTQRIGTGTSVPLTTSLRLSAMKTESNTAPLGGNGKRRQTEGNRNGGNKLVYDKLLFYVICVFTLCRKLFY